MKTTFHHVHLFATDLEKSLAFYQQMFDARIVFDTAMAGARNVMIAIGAGKINFYDQPPKERGRGVVHHLGIETDDLEALVKHMEGQGYSFRKGIKDYGTWKYIMAEAPDSVLLEIFQVVHERLPKSVSEDFSSL